MNITKLNTYTSISNAISVGFFSFVTFKIAIAISGIETTGLWALLLTFNSVAIAFTSATTTTYVQRIASKSNAQKKKLESLHSILIHLLLSVTFFLFLYVLTHFSLFDLLKLPQPNELYANSLLTITSASLLIINNGLNSILDGNLITYKRNISTTFSYIIFTLFIYLFSKPNNLSILVIGQFLQQLICFILNSLFIFSKKNLYVELNFRNLSIRNIFHTLYHSKNLQLSTALQLTFDPFIKYLLGTQSELSHITIYEFANRIVSQIRALTVSASQLLIAIIAKSNSSNPIETEKIFNQALTINRIPNFLILNALIASSYPLGIYLFKGNVAIFTQILIILAGSSYINISSNPYYFSLIANNNTSSIAKSSLIISLLNILLGFILSNSHQTVGIATAWAISLSMGSFFIICNTPRKTNKPLCIIIHPTKHLPLFLTILSLLILTISPTFLYFKFSVALVFLSVTIFFCEKHNLTTFKTIFRKSE